MVVLTLGRICKFIPPRRHKGGGGGWNPFPEFLICCSISKRFSLQWKAFDLLNKMWYIYMDGGAAGVLWRYQQWSPSWLPSLILLRIRNQLKTARNDIFLCLQWTLCMILATRITFTNERSWKYTHIRAYMQIHTPGHCGTREGGWMEPLSGVFDMLQYFETI